VGLPQVHGGGVVSHHLITGGAGFIGSNLAHRLVREGHTVTVLDRFSRGKISRLPKAASTTHGDIRDPATVMQAAQNADVIWHLAYVQGTQTFYADPKDVIDVALRGIMNVLGACEAMGGDEALGDKPDLFLVSSSEVYQDPPAGMFPTDETVPLSVPDVTNPRYSYGGGKIASELATLAYSQAGHLGRAVIVRPHNIYGPDMGHEHVIPEFATQMIGIQTTAPGSQPFKIQGSGQETRSFCYIDDCVDGLMVLLARSADRNVYHLGNPNEEHTIKELAFAVADWFGQKITLVPGQLPRGSPTRRLPDIGKLAALGYEPKVPLAEGLACTLDWYQHEHDRLEAAA
jgi:nucleoside-diphosphate-sugar epimerase